MIRRPPRSTRTDTLFPYPTLFRSLNAGSAAHGNKDARLAEVKKQQQAWESELADWSMKDGSPIAPRRALRELEKAMPKNAMVTTDIGNICSVSNSYLRFDKPKSFFAAMSRSEERRVGTECVSTCRSRWSPYH